jgi:hypothetical protein
MTQRLALKSHLSGINVAVEVNSAPSVDPNEERLVLGEVSGNLGSVAISSLLA